MITEIIPGCSSTNSRSVSPGGEANATGRVKVTPGQAFCSAKSDDVVMGIAGKEIDVLATRCVNAEAEAATIRATTPTTVCLAPRCQDG